MSIGTYGNIHSSNISPNDVDIFYVYSPTREELSTEVFRLTPESVLEALELPENEKIDGEENLLGGLYNLTLPSNIFNELGFYTIYIRPKVIRNTIIDCGVLSALPTVKGIVLDANKLDTSLTTNNALQGYKIEYINDDGSLLRNTVRYVVTSNRVTPVTENIGTTSQTSIRYRFDDSGNLLFLQLTPSSATSVKPNSRPFIGKPNQTILISNTNVNPLSIEVELVENDIESVIDYVAGEMIKDVDNGILTYMNSNREILRQFNLFEIKDDVGDVSLYEIKERRTNIDTSQDLNDILEDI